MKVNSLRSLAGLRVGLLAVALFVCAAGCNSSSPAQIELYEPLRRFTTTASEGQRIRLADMTGDLEWDQVAVVDPAASVAHVRDALPGMNVRRKSWSSSAHGSIVLFFKSSEMVGYGYDVLSVVEIDAPTGTYPGSLEMREYGLMLVE